MPKPIYLGPQEIVELADLRASQFAERNAEYAKDAAYYFGRPDRSQSGQSIKAMDTKGRPLLRYLGSWESMGQKLVSNVAKPIVSDYQAVIGRVPKVRADPLDESTAAKEKAERLTKLLLSANDLSEAPMQQADAGFYASALGDCLYCLEVDPETKRVVWCVVNPMNCFPLFDRGWRRHQLHDVVIASLEDPDVLLAEYGLRVPDDEDESRRLITYLSKWQRTVVVGRFDQPHKGEVIADVKHDLGFCPARWHHNEMADGEHGTSDIRQIRSLQDYYNFSLNVAADGLVEMTYPVNLLVGPLAFSEDQLEVGPGATVAVEEGGDLRRIAPTPPPNAAAMILDLTRNDMLMVSGTSSIRMQGEQHSSIQTGRSIHAAQGPQATRLDLRQVQFAFTFNRLYAMLLQMQEKAPGLRKQKIEVNGRMAGKEFRMEMSTDEIDGQYQNTVTFDALVGLNRQQKLQIAMEGTASKMWDDVYGRDLAGVEDPVGMWEAIQQQAIREAQLQVQQQRVLQEAQQQAGSPAGGSPGGQGAPGGSPTQPTPPMIFRPRELAAPQPPAGVPQGVSLRAVQDALARVATQLRGTVFAVGDLAYTGQAQQVQIRITDYRDQRTVKQALAQIAPTAQIRVMRSEEAMGEMRARVA